MALEKTLSNPAIQVGNKSIAIKPNSLVYKSGKGDKNVRSQSAGGASIENVVTEDAETKKSMVKFTLFNTKTNIDNLEEWQDAVNGNSIEFSDGAFQKAFRQMVVTGDPEISLGAEGETEIEFEGLPLV